MASRRKEMWKLLYDLVNKSETDLNNVFTFVDDILCKEPSLIRSYSLKASNNSFQDDFIVWIFNKVLRYLSNNRSKGIHEKNIETQKRLLGSCLVNRPLLFEHLVSTYIATLNQLGDQLPETLLDLEPSSSHEDCKTLEVTAFMSQNVNLREIDSNFTFQPIIIRLNDSDEYVQALLNILRFALSKGYCIYSEIFQNSLCSVFKVIKECDLATKVLSLRYCGELFQYARPLNSALENYYELTVETVALICEQLPIWQQVDCVIPQQVDDLIDVIIFLFTDQTRQVKQLHRKQRVIKLSIDVIRNLGEIALQAQMDVPPTMEIVINNLVEFIVELQLQSEASDLIEQHCDFFFRLAKLYPFVIRVHIASLLHQRKSSEAISPILRIFEQQILELLFKNVLLLSDLKILYEILNGLAYFEHHWCLQEQLMSYYKSERIDAVRELNCIECPQLLFAGESIHNYEENIGKFLKNTENYQEIELITTQLKIIGLLLRITSLRKLLSLKMQERLVCLLEKPIKIFIASPNEHNSVRKESAFIALKVLADISFPETVKVFKHLQNIWRSIGSQIFTKTNTFHGDDIMTFRLAFCDSLIALVMNGFITKEQLMRDFLKGSLEKPILIARMLRIISCCSDPSTSFVLKSSPFTVEKAKQIQLFCLQCSKSIDVPAIVRIMCEERSILIVWPTSMKSSATFAANLSNYLTPLKSMLCRWVCTDPEFIFVGHHLSLFATTADEFYRVLPTMNSISDCNVHALRIILPKLICENDNFLMQIAKLMLENTFRSLETSVRERQLKMLQLLDCCTFSSMTDHWLYHFYKMTFFFLVHPDSHVAHDAVICATEMCARHNLQPIHLWNWYKRDALSLIINLAVSVYVKKGVRLTRSLKAFTKMLGFSCVQEFVCKYYRLLITMILPYCVKQPQCKGLIVSISKITRKPVSTLFAVSFLRIYTHIYLTEDADVCNKCIDLIVQCTGRSLTQLLNTDVKQTVSEFLIYFNRNPKFVMEAFQTLLSQESSRTSAIVQRNNTGNTNEFAKFIADRFLGVITYFETCLAEPNFEKPLKEEALYSLGQIMRFVGSNHVTQFRFKIIAMLSFVLTLNEPHLQSICLKIWNIFLHIVNIQELGPSLSRIVASLQPLLAHNKDEVNSIYEFVILKNDSLLGAYIPDLYFVENIDDVAPAIRQCVSRQTEILKSNKSTLLDKIGFLHRQITNENLQVRIYGLNYLRDFMAAEREAINRLILNEIRVNTLLENVVDILMSGCRHEDRKLQLASAKCLGELGAIDPSYMPSHFTFELAAREMALSVHTDDFAIMALTELCRAYQFQKDTKYVDNFSLAIQETLSVFGVSPKESKKLNIWEAIPLRLQQVMEPLLSSCYTGSRRESKCKEHPIFNSSFCRRYEEWAFVWASRLIEIVKTEETNHLFNSYRPSIKRDSNTMVIFFPYILLHAVQECTEAQMHQIYEEFEAVFSFSSRGVIAKPEYETTGTKEFLSTKYSADNNADAGNKLSTAEQYDAMENISRNCTKLCSEQIDFLQRWIREWERLNVIGEKQNALDDNYMRIKKFLEKFDKQLIARANYNSGDYARALMYLEEYIEIDAKVRLQEEISFLIEIHGNLMDADSVEGAVYMKKSNLNLAEEILVNRIVDRPQEMMTCYEELMSDNEQINQEHIKGMINCYLRMDTPETALLITDGLWQKLTDQFTDDYFKECKFELLWRLGRYDELQELLEDSVVRRKTSNWNVQCAEAFLLYRQPIKKDNFKFDNFVNQLDVIRCNVLCTMRSCAGVNRNSYPHSYDEVIKLHLLNEVEKIKLLLMHLSDSLVETISEAREKSLDEVRQFFDEWDARLAILQPVVRIMEPVLCFRRNLLIETKRLLDQHFVDFGMSPLRKDIGDSIDEEIGKLWIRSVQMNRDAGNLQQAQISLMKATKYEPKTLFIEKAKLLWVKGDQTNSFKLIEENLERILTKCDNNASKLSGIDRWLYAEAKFLQATYNAESMNICSELNLSYFKEAISGNRKSEKCYVHLAQYLDKLHDSYSQEQKDGENGHKLLFDIMFNYAKSLKHGCENVYQSLPRLLSIWLDFTAEVAQPSSTAINDAIRSPAAHTLAQKMNDLIVNCSTVLPTSVFYTAFSQLLSRICHPSENVFNALRVVIVKLVEHFPHQSLWMLLPIFKSSSSERIKRCKVILTDSRLSKQQFPKLLADFNMLAERLIELTNKAVTMDQTYKLSGLVKQLPKLFENSKFSNILLPFEKYMQASFPLKGSTTFDSLSLSVSQESGTDASASIPTNPFPYQQIYITGINEDIVVLRSNAQPKKITIRCSDGKCYDVMVKPKDDLRRDFRLMEFNGLVKRYLYQDSQARHRRLRIRTYAAIPFNEECGLVEWLPKLCSFRSLCYGIYRARGLGVPDRMLRQYSLPKERPIEEKRKLFLEKLLPRFPPVFQEWFRKRFPTPHSWYEARCAYVKTAAVMSIVGYILGLGDRHGENVLLDETNGDVVHVDFNCLFNFGELLQYPELVPFRLTHNMVFAMGPLGVEGMYRKCCEITLRVLRHESKTLMSVLRPFVHDLMVLNTCKQKQGHGEMSSLKSMMRSLRRIEARFDGYVKKTLGNSMPLSTEGQVNFLIAEATDIDNLAAMYIGWGSFI